ncbi:calcium-binding protein [Microvirga lotononidis]|uniref:Putative calcium-binding protein n=1 Tax=Microvirga lotononidis TaxID=864069 RepID=I4Z2F7_9HYPH|nr:calcium-binding protein [Microvirga lotononidis]EIM30399.1 putative calcium-binding protein [Microvirga lotononidis]WQO30900.1 calcium-binding protein [Microvirga lotononidis]
MTPNSTTGSLIDGAEVVSSLVDMIAGAKTKLIQVSAIQSGRVDDTGSSLFADIPLDTSEGKAALLAKLAEGSGLLANIHTVDGQFDPTSNITREDLAVLLARILKLEMFKPTGTPSFSDVAPGVSDWTVNYVKQAVEAGLVNAVSSVELTGVASRDTILNGLPTYNNLMVLDASSDGVHRRVEINNVGFIALKGVADIYGGNGAQFIVADGASQRIVMGADDDTMHGGGGDDYVGSLGGNDELHGDEGNDTISGGIGNDTLDGGTGIDIMYGGEGDDTYIVDTASDQVIEYRGEGIDTLRSSVSYMLENANVENLVLTGNGAYGYGNGVANRMTASDAGSVLYGWGGNDTLWGGASRDRLYGGSGDDRLYGNGGNDRLYGGTGKDRLEGGTGRDYLAGDSGNDILKGGDGHDTINGGSGNDVIYGGTGKDILTGGTGRDTFVFDTKLGKGEIDTIRDFNPWEDTIRLENAVFTNIGPKGHLAWNAFHYGTHAADADDRIIYDWFSGALYYDEDGAGGAAQVQFARIDKHVFLTVNDFVII